MTDTIVVGAGIIGATTALYLARQGLRVTVIEREAGAGLGTSFANGGLLAANSTMPWSSPNTPKLLFKWMGKEDAPLLLRPRAIPGLGLWGLRFLTNCRPSKYQATSSALTALGQRSLEEMTRLFDEKTVQSPIGDGGFLELFRGRDAALNAERFAVFLEGLGGTIERLDAAAVVALEPSLAPVAHTIGRALLLKLDRWGDAWAFTQATAKAAATAGATFCYGKILDRIEVGNDAVSAVHVDGERIAARRVVLCAGSYASQLLKPLGLRLPIAPVKGYSITLMEEEIGFLPTRPIVDDHEHITATPLGDRLRVAGTVEFDGFNMEIRPSRIANLKRALQSLYPDISIPREVNAWCGLRPMSADGLPFIGPTPIPGLFVNTGHGAVGWTLACGSAELLAKSITGNNALLDSPFRFGRSVW